MNKLEKTKEIERLVELVNSNSKFYFADCSSLSVEKVNQLRRSCFQKNVTMMVVKNSLLAKALERASDSQLAEMIPALKGQTAILFTEVSNAPAKIIKEFRKNTDKPKLKAAYVEDMIFIGDDKLDSLASLKSKNELIADVVSLLQSPIRRVIGALENKPEKAA